MLMNAIDESWTLLLSLVIMTDLHACSVMVEQDRSVGIVTDFPMVCQLSASVTLVNYVYWPFDRLK